MKNISWPVPPMHKKRTPPEIPESLRLFGLEYKSINGNPIPNIESMPLDKLLIKNLIRESVYNFSKLLKTFDYVYLNNINEIHTKLNELFNKAMEHEKINALDEERDKVLSEKIALYEKIKKIIDY